MINPKNILQHELIGLPTQVVSSSNPSSKGISGVTVDETTHTLVVEKDSIARRVFKKSSTFVFGLPNERVEVKGIALDGHPWDRIKKRG